MTRLEALRAAKDAGFTHAVLHPYTYHARTIESHIQEAQTGQNDISYPGSSAASEVWTFDVNENAVNGDSAWYSLSIKDAAVFDNSGGNE
jgi:hypothetical protein